MFPIYRYDCCIRWILVVHIFIFLLVLNSNHHFYLFVHRVLVSSTSNIPFIYFFIFHLSLFFPFYVHYWLTTKSPYIHVLHSRIYFYCHHHTKWTFKQKLSNRITIYVLLLQLMLPACTDFVMNMSQWNGKIHFSSHFRLVRRLH